MKFSEIGGRRVPTPRCILYNQRYMRITVDVFDGRISVPICFQCNGHPDAVEKCEKKLQQIFEKEPAFYHGEKDNGTAQTTAKP